MIRSLMQEGFSLGVLVVSDNTVAYITTALQVGWMGQAKVGGKVRAANDVRGLVNRLETCKGLQENKTETAMDKFISSGLEWTDVSGSFRKEKAYFFFAKRILQSWMKLEKNTLTGSIYISMMVRRGVKYVLLSLHGRVQESWPQNWMKFEVNI